MESLLVSDFRGYILDGNWRSAEAALLSLGMTEDEGLWVSSTLMFASTCQQQRVQGAKFLIGQQKYLELLESRKTIPALNILRNELAPLNVDPAQLQSLTAYVQVLASMSFFLTLRFSSLMMCSDPADLRQRAGWDGAGETSRRKLLANLQSMVILITVP
jgi:hypothetical protein